ncbi:hypothetical protein ACE6H2_011185 [Prunus campanulata]
MDSFAEENSNQGEKLPTKVHDPGWIVVATRKGKAKMQERDGRTFKEVAKRIKMLKVTPPIQPPGIKDEVSGSVHIR